MLNRAVGRHPLLGQYDIDGLPSRCENGKATDKLLTSNINVPPDSFVSASGKGRTAIQGLTLKHLSITILAGALFMVALPAAAQTPVQVAELLADDGADFDQFGWAVAVWGDTAVFGAPGDDDLGSSSGAAYVFVRNGTSWTQQAKLLADDGVEFDQFGYSVTGSGNTVMIGAGVLNGSGAAYVFVRNGTTWTQQAKLLADDGTADSQFGFSMALSGDTAVFGASGDNDLGSFSGAAYVFVRNGTSWSQQAKLLADDGVEFDQLGSSVAISGETAVIGSANHNVLGSAYVFVRDGTSWTQQAELLADDGALEDAFGTAVAIFGDTAVITAQGDDDLGSYSGSAYVFVRDGTSWTQQAKLLADDGAMGDTFGSAVVLEGDTAVLAARRSSSGAAYVFVRNGTSWIQQAKLLADDGSFGDEFGSSVAVSGSTLVVGSQYHDHPETSRGSAYVYELALRPELILRRSTDNRWFSYVLSFKDNANVVIEDKGFANMTRNVSYQTVSRGDFDGDGIADVLVRDMVGTENGRWVMYTLDGPAIKAGGPVNLTRNADWQVVASDDFDGDSKSDLLLRNVVDGRWLLYLLDSQTVKSQGIVVLSTDLADSVVGTGDFNNDGRHDILTRRADGTWLMYLFDGLSVPAVSTPAMTTNMAFAVQSLADFNGDGNTDVLLRRNDGRWFLYMLDGSMITASGSPAMTENTAFSLVSDADFNGDGTADALLRRTDGRWYLYSLDGVSILSEGNLNMTRNPSFQIVSTDDFNGDGKADALLRRGDGRWVLYALDGTVPTILGQGAPDMTRNTAWVPQTIPSAPLDTTPPVINLLGNNPQVITTGTAYTELGATAMDDFDGDISGSVVIDSSAVNTSTAGSYSVTYDVTDSSGNMADTVIRTVTVEDPPDDPY